MPYKNREDRLNSCKKRYLQNKDEVSVDRKEYRKENFDKIAAKKREWHLKTTFGISVDDYNRMFDEQNGCCNICLKHQITFKIRLAVDHDHVTGKIRGLLCEACNTSLGKFEDSIDNLERALQYLKKHKEN